MTDPGADRRERVGELGRLAETDPATLGDHVQELQELLGADSAYVRRRTARVVTALAAARPDAATPLVERLTERLADESAQDDAAAALARVAEGDPGAVVDHLPALVAALDDEGPVVVEAAAAIAALAAARPETLAQPGILDRLFDLLADEQAGARRNGAVALAEVASVDRAAVCEGGDALRTALADDDAAVRRHAALALGTAGPACPERVLAAVPDLVASLDHPDGGVRAGAAYALGHAVRAGDRVQSTADALLGALDDDDGTVRQHATFALAVLAADDPDAVRPGVDALARRVADESGAVRRNARSALESLESAYPAVVSEAVDGVVTELAAVDEATETVAFTEAELRGLAGDADAPGDQRAAADHALALVESGAVDAATVTRSPDVSTAGAGQGETGETTADEPADGPLFCPECGTQVDAGGEFCPECGTQV